jgi:hypothetical protein
MEVIKQSNNKLQIFEIIIPYLRFDGRGQDRDSK